ncbi:hypothetical protein H2508_04560 [Parahaliea sp. F7430]|uniref:Uncharacterized protein n=1 Tax=Sediminihaliea albiluteola TaxID=2758564 RepID=A0A7W2TV03_9GAMM|nr:hypothetical protein [Sediminihaliea albiluteola]MBA6412378.1 hypothetical protein [Sediminihaliea albiluteola]
MILHHNKESTEAVSQAMRETGSTQAHRLVSYLLVNGVAITHDIARDCAIGNISCAASYIRPALQKRGYTILATRPEKPILNRFGETSQIHEWRLIRLR